MRVSEDIAMKMRKGWLRAASLLLSVFYVSAALSTYAPVDLP
jgi:hypothetical protein